MKIRQLHINRFGHFTDFDLVFPGEGLQVVFGPNEAGKTTLLEFLRSLLFDFHPRTPYDFGGSGEMAGVATLAMRDGRMVELRRRKGNKDKVSIKLDDRPTDLDDAGWLRMLDHADRGLFESVFAFGLDQLSQGEASLKHESLQSALFGGSLGGTSSPDKVTAELTRQADDLFKKGGSKPAINALLADLKHLAKEIKDRSLRPEKYQQAEEAVAKATDQAKRLHEQVEQLRREHSKIEKRVRAWPKWWDLQQRLGQRSGLSVPENIPNDARQRYQNLSKDLAALAEDQAKRKHEIEQAAESLTAVKLDPAAVSQRAAIKSCLELRQSFVEAKQDLPERQQERDTMRLQVDRELAELRPGWSHDDLLAFSVDVATREGIERLNDERRARMTACTKLTATREADAANLELALDELAELGTPREVTVLTAVLADEADFVASRKQADGARGELAKLERKLATQCRKLVPPLSAAAAAPQELPVPRSETVAEFETGFADLREQLRAASASIEQDEAEGREIERSLAAALSGHAVPSLDERDAARTRRDAGWELVRRKFILAKPADEAISRWLGGADASLPESYEQAVRQADDIADQIYENANEVAKREALRRQLQTVGTRIEQKKERLAELDRRQADLQARWLALWQPCGFRPLAPDAMLGWLQDHEAAGATVARRDELTEELSRMDARIASFEQRLRAAGDLPGVDIPHLLALARMSVDEAKGQQRKASELQKTIRRLEPQLAKHDEKLQALATGEAAASAEWRALLSGLNLPADWDTELARTVIDKLKATRVRLDGIPGQEARIGAIQARIQEFEQRVCSLCETLEPELLRDPPELAIEKLAEHVEQAVEARRKHEALSQKLFEARKQLEVLNERHAKLDAERIGLFALAKAATETEFLEVVSLAEKISRLDGEIEQIRRELDLIRGGDDREEFESSLADSDRAVLESQQRDLAEQLGRQEPVKRAADESVGAARKELSQLDGSSGVALLSEELARRRSQLAAEVDRYVPLIYARHLLNAAVSRFERENQPEMIATVSRLLGQMTGGKYIEFDRAGGGKQSMLVRRADGVERTSAQLSTGTREQLYLAIRLAYVIHYCDRNEPLPIVIDDVLVNFDATRTRRTLAALAGISQTAQVLLFTCHAHMMDMAPQVVPGLQPVELSGVSGKQ